MSTTTYFAAHAGDEERLRLAGLEALYDATTQRRLLAAPTSTCSAGAADPAAPGAALVDRVTQRSLAATERAGVWRNALGPRLPDLFVGAGLRDVACDGACWIVPLERHEVMALIIQSLQLIAVHGIAAGEVTESEVQGAIDLIRSRSLRMVSPTIFGTVGRRAQ